MNERRKVDPILIKIEKSVDRIDNTIHGNGKIGLKSRVLILWYAGWAAFIVMSGVLISCVL